MRLMLLVALGGFATLATIAVFLTPIHDVLASITGAIAWGLFAFGATNVETVTQCCITRESEPMLMWFGVAMTLLMVLTLVFGTVEFVDARDSGPELGVDR